MYEVTTETYTPDNFIAGIFPIAKESKTVTSGKAVAKYAPVKLVSGGTIEPVAYVAASAAQDYSAATAAVHTLVIGASFAAGDTITINGVVYTCVASDATGNQFVAGTASQVAASLRTLLASDLEFTVGGSSANVTFTQKVAGIGAIPTVETTVTSGASISTTTDYVAGTDPLPAKTATENTTAGLYGIAVEAADAGKETIVYLTGEFKASALVLEDDVTASMLESAFRKLGIFIKS